MESSDLIGPSRSALINIDALRKDSFHPNKEGGNGMTRDEQILIDIDSIILLEYGIHAHLCCLCVSFNDPKLNEI